MCHLICYTSTIYKILKQCFFIENLIFDHRNTWGFLNIEGSKIALINRLRTSDVDDKKQTVYYNRNNVVDHIVQ